MEPSYVNSNHKIQELKTNVNELFSNPRPQRHSSRVEDRKKIEDLLKDFSSDMNSLQNKFDCVATCITGILDTLENMDERMTAVEKKT